jgi:serine/threonine protein kinase
MSWKGNKGMKRKTASVKRKPAMGNVSSKPNGHNGNRAADTHFLSALVMAAESNEGLLLGECLLDRYTLEEVIGTGSITTVYKAYDSLLDKYVAIKTFATGSIDHGTCLSVLSRETRIQHHLRDLRFVVRIFDIHSTQDPVKPAHFVAMELADGGNLRNWLKSRERHRKTRQKQGWKIFLQICVGYASIHRQGFYLLDAKPENILLVHGVPKVSDIALAVSQSDYWKESDPLDIKPSERGTLEYMSPEQLDCVDLCDLGPASDVYSIARVGHEILHPMGRQAFDITPEQLRNGPPAYPIIPDLDDAINDVFAKGLDADPSARYADMTEFLRALVQASGESADTFDCLRDRMIDNREDARIGKLGPNGGIRNRASGNSQTRLKKNLIADDSHKALQKNPDIDEAGRLCRLIIDEESSWDLQTLRDYACQAEKLYPSLPELKLALLKLESKERLYGQLLALAWEALNTMDLEVSKCLLLQAQTLNPGDVRLARAAQVVTWLLQELEASIQGRTRQPKPQLSQQKVKTNSNTDCCDLDTIMDEAVEYVGVLLGMESTE